MQRELNVEAVRRALEGAGCVAADEEAAELIATTTDHDTLRQMLDRRLTGEPLAWITGRASFCNVEVFVEPGVYVPRWQSEPLAIKAGQLLPATGVGVDLCTGSGAVAKVMQAARPGALVVTTEVDPVAARCARRNGLVVYEGDLDQPLPASLVAQVDVMAGVLPYVPTDALHLLSRDVQRFEPPLALNGGRDGLELIARVVHTSPRWLKAGGWLLLELGGDQAVEVRELLVAAGFGAVTTVEDEDGDTRAIYGQRGISRGSSITRGQ